MSATSNRFRFAAVFVVVSGAVACTFASTAAHGTARVAYADIEGCVQGCEVAAVGFPFPFIADYPGISPVGDASVLGVFFSSDRVLAPQLMASAFCWLLVCCVGTWAIMKRVRS